MKNKNIIKISIIIFSILLVLVALITTTQAYFNRDNYANNPTEYQTGLLSIEAASKSNSISLSNTLPMSDTDGEKSTPYVFTIRNNGNVDYKFNVKLLSTSDNTFSPEYIKLIVDNEEAKTLSALTDSIIKKDLVLPAGETVDITLRVWLSLTTPNTQIGKTFNSKIVIDGQSVYTSTNQDVPTYKIEYDTNGGAETIASEKVTVGNKVTISNTKPTKAGYTFKGWSTSGLATTASYQPGDTITIEKNTKLYAVWEAIIYNLTLNKGTGVNNIYYKSSASSGRQFQQSKTNIVLKGTTGLTYYYYGDALTGYTMSSCTEASPCTETIGTSSVTRTLTATANSYNLTLTKGTGVAKIYYKINGASSYLTTASTKTLSVKYGTTYYYYGVPSTNYTMTSCTATNPCSGTMGTSAVSKTLSATSSSVLTVTVYRKLGSLAATQLQSTSAKKGENFSYEFAARVTQSGTTYTYSKVTCTNSQTPTITTSLNNRILKLSALTSSTACTITYKTFSSGGGTVIS